MFFP
jgi:hypothetical protein